MPKWSYFGVIFETFWSLGGNGRIELSLQRELDPGGWGGSRNHTFSTFFLGTDIMRIFMLTLSFFSDFRSPKGALGSQIASK